MFQINQKLIRLPIQMCLHLANTLIAHIFYGQSYAFSNYFLLSQI